VYFQILYYPPANGANERSEICVVSRGGNFFNKVKSLAHTYMVVRHLSVSLSVCLLVCLSVSLLVCLSVCLSVTHKHENISKTTEWILTKICTHILQKKSMSQNRGELTLNLTFSQFCYLLWRCKKKFKFFWLQVFLDILGASLAKKNGVPMS